MERDCGSRWRRLYFDVSPDTLNMVPWLRDGGPWAMLVIAGIVIVYLWRELMKARDGSQNILREWHSDSRELITKMTEAVSKQSEALHAFSSAIGSSIGKLEESMRDVNDTIEKLNERMWTNIKKDQ